MKAYIKDDFKNLLEYREWLNEKFKDLLPDNSDHYAISDRTLEYYIKKGDDWFGSGTTIEELKGGITQYKDPELLKKIYDKVNHTVSMNKLNTVKAPRMKFNPFGLGMFIFDRAAMGMYRLEEFYSPDKKRVVDREQVVEYRNNYYLKEERTPVVKRWEEKEDGSPKVRTINKNVYAYYPKVNNAKNAVELFIICGGHSAIKAEGLLYSGISAIILAQILEGAKIRTKITIVIGTSPDKFQSVYGCFIPVKQYDEKLDMNLLSLLTSDPRFYRYEGFKGIIAAYDHFGKVAPTTLGATISRQTLKEVVELSIKSKGQPLPEIAFYFGGTFTEKEAIADVSEALKEIAEKLNR